MTHHHHEPGHAHPVARVAPSLLRMSALERIGAATVVAGILWIAVWWVTGQS